LLDFKFAWPKCTTTDTRFVGRGEYVIWK
jgi:hypothetical protein